MNETDLKRRAEIEKQKQKKKRYNLQGDVQKKRPSTIIILIKVNQQPHIKKLYTTFRQSFRLFAESILAGAGVTVSHRKLILFRPNGRSMRHKANVGSSSPQRRTPSQPSHINRNLAKELRYNRKYLFFQSAAENERECERQVSRSFSFKSKIKKNNTYLLSVVCELKSLNRNNLKERQEDGIKTLQYFEWKMHSFVLPLFLRSLISIRLN